MAQYRGVSTYRLRPNHSPLIPPDALQRIDQPLSSRDLPLHTFVGNSPCTQQVAAQVFWEIPFFGV